MKIIAIIGLGILLIGVIGSKLYEYLNKRRVYNQLKLMHRYLKAMDMDDIMIRYKGKVFYIAVDSLPESPRHIYKKLLYVNEELVLTAYELDHGNTNSRLLQYNHNRSEYEVDKLQRLAYKKLKRMYYEKYLKADYSFKSFWED